ncbi:MAG: phage integrase SAM-like domain-containing protein, partial [Bacteroidota bacterium]
PHLFLWWFLKSGNKWGERAEGQFDSFCKTLDDYAKHKTLTLKIENIDMSFCEDFVNFMFDEKEYATNTVGSKIKNLNTFMGWADKSGLVPNNHYKFFKKPSAPTNIIALTTSEFQRFFNHEFKDPKLERARDLFIFGASTGLRYSDLNNLTQISFVEGDIVGVTKKTKDRFEIPVNHFAEVILKKYDFQLPKISSQKLNQYLKLAAKEAKLNREIEIVQFRGQKRISQISELS